MRVLGIIFAAAMATVALAGCTNTLRGKQLAEYCSIERNQGKDLCVVNGEIAAVRTTANEAKSIALEANAKQVNCTTVTLNRVKSASCAPGYALMGCTQTRYTKRAGGMAILRSVNDQACTYNSRVLEVQARCCQVGAPMTTAAAAPAPAPAAPKPAQPTS